MIAPPGVYTGRRYKIKAICKVCRLLRIITPLYKTTKEQRDEIKRNYICSDHRKDKPLDSSKEKPGA